MNKTTITGINGTHLYSDKPTNIVSLQTRSVRYFLAVLPFALVLLISTSYQQNPDDLSYQDQDSFFPGITDSLRNYILSGDGEYLLLHGQQTSMNKEFLVKFYERNGFKPVWVHINGLNERANGLIAMIENAHEFGLEPENYHFSVIKKLEHLVNTNADINRKVFIEYGLEILLTDAAFHIMINLHAGYVSFDSALYKQKWVHKLNDVLLHGIATGKISESFSTVEPRFIEYTQLRKANENFVRTSILCENHMEIVYPNKDSAVLIFQIKESLIDLGYLQNSCTVEQMYAALKGFQQYHGLTPDGKIGENTVEALNKDKLYRYRILALNLDRLRKYQYRDKDLLYINIPAYKLKVMHNNRIQDTFRVIVGNPASPTPTLSGIMQSVIANPVWYVPKSIAINEVLPKVKEDSNYLKKNGFNILDKNYRLVNPENINLAEISEDDFDYTFRQNRGSDNSLGQVKFIFSNPYAVYLHDTPGKSLFNKDLRAFSHGCIRIEDPERLANYILNKFNSDTTDISHLIVSGKQHEFKISGPLSIHITYITCEADVNGKLYFYKDIYGVDSKQLQELNTFIGI